MTCLTCTHWDAKSTPPEIRRVRLAICARGPRWEYLPSHAVCPKFTPAPPEVAEARLKWKERADAGR